MYERERELIPLLPMVMQLLLLLLLLLLPLLLNAYGAAINYGSPGPSYIPMLGAFAGESLGYSSSGLRISMTATRTLLTQTASGAPILPRDLNSCFPSPLGFPGSMTPNLHSPVGGSRCCAILAALSSSSSPCSNQVSNDNLQGSLRDPRHTGSPSNLQG
jgi:hypothetical protein